jgi:hypothetical protein
MICATKGRISAVQGYEDKKTGELIRNAFVATGEHMISVRLSDEQIFEEDDLVIVAGELKVFERRFYINGGSIRIASPEDLAFFKAAATGATASGAPSHETAVSTQKNGQKVGV